MNEEEKLTRVFTGSLVDAEYLKYILEENGIGALIKNSMKESLIAGWVSAVPEDAARLFVAEKNKSKAEKLITAYLESEKGNSNDEEN